MLRGLLFCEMSIWFMCIFVVVEMMMMESLSGLCVEMNCRSVLFMLKCDVSSIMVLSRKLLRKRM